MSSIGRGPSTRLDDKKRPPAEAEGLSSQIEGESLEIDLEACLDHVDAIFRARRSACLSVGSTVAANGPPSMYGVRVVEQHTHIVFGDPGQAGLQAELLAALAERELRRSRRVQTPVRKLLVQPFFSLLALEVEIIDAADHLERAPCRPC